jgi:hypothetical protein
LNGGGGGVRKVRATCPAPASHVGKMEPILRKNSETKKVCLNDTTLFGKTKIGLLCTVGKIRKN